MADISPTGIVPESLIDVNQRDAFYGWLMAQGFRAQFKRDLLFGWARTVFTKVSGDDVKMIRVRQQFADLLGDTQNLRDTEAAILITRSAD